MERAMVRSKAWPSSILPSIRGFTPVSQAASNWGAMMNAVMNMASDITTVFGGLVLVPIARRRIDSTVTMRVKAVTIMKIAGAMLSTVSSTNNWTMRVVVEPGRRPCRNRY